MAIAIVLISSQERLGSIDGMDGREGGMNRVVPNSKRS
jgi:hypothetical protein